MKLSAIAAAFALGSISSTLADETQRFQGSDTLTGVMSAAIIAAGMEGQLVYAGGGSGKGEAAMLSGDQGLAPMSREVTPEALKIAKDKKLELIPHVIGLDGIGIFVNAKNAVQSVDLAMLAKIYSCQAKNWEELPGSHQTGAIVAYRRNDQAGTTDTFKHLTGLKKFGDCVKIVAETADIANATSKETLAIGYAGLSAKREENQPLAVAKDSQAKAVSPTVESIRDFSYPLARNLYVYEVGGARTPNETEQEFLFYITDRSFMDPIIKENDFFTID